MQQFTCPKCLQDYTGLTASLHTGCGTVEPKIESKPTLENADIPLSDIEVAKMVEANKEPIVINMIPKAAIAETVAPKKRGRPAKAK